MSDEQKLPDNSTADATAWAKAHQAEQQADSGMVEWDIDANRPVEKLTTPDLTVSYPAEIIPMESDLEKDLGHLLNKHSAENESGTPDFILATFLAAQLDLFNYTIKNRAAWRGESVELPALLRLHQDTSTMDRVIAYLRAQVEEGVITLNQPIEATDLFRELMDYKPREKPDLEQGGLEAGDTQGPDVDLGTWEPQKDDAPATEQHLDVNDGREVPLVAYSDGQRNEIGTATLRVFPGEALVTERINSVTAIFDEPVSTKDDPDYPLQEPKDEPPKPTGRFARYQQEGLSS